METIQNPQLDLAFNFVQYTNKNLFLTGKAGTGKTTFLHNLRTKTFKRMIVVAPTGVAAINAGGVTIHSFFQMPFGPHIPSDVDNRIAADKNGNPFASGFTKISKSKINIIKSLDLLVIDEISMVRADLLDGVDEVLRRYKDRYKPFGGVQLLMIGDIQQLAPVIKDDEWELLRPYYETVYFFSSRALRKTDFISIELKHIYRQSDKDFIEILNKIRENKLDKAAFDALNKRYKPGFSGNTEDGYITLTTHNSKAQEINNSRLSQIKKKAYTFKASVNGDFPEYSYPTESDLVLKEGAQVMFVKNDISRDKLFYNGKIGVIENIDEESIHVKCTGDENSIEVSRAEWQNNKYTINPDTKEISESVIGAFVQYPLKLAWAITIHKSQGLTFEKAIIDANASFAHGQVYVALSRCRNLEGLILSTQINSNSIKNDSTVIQFSSDIESNAPSQQHLKSSIYEYQKSLLYELYDFSRIQSQLNYCIKVIKEHHLSLLGNVSEEFQQIFTQSKSSIADVSLRFKPELDQLLTAENEVEKNDQLQQRIKDACVYFTNKMETVFKIFIKGTVVESDNKTIRKSVNDAIERLQEDLLLKLACIKHCQQGFRLREYLDVRAKAAIKEDSAVKKEYKKEEPIAYKNIEHPELFSILKIWRTSRADELNQPVFMILHQNVLVEICRLLPSSSAQLKQIKGFGKKKISQFGKEVLEIINDYCLENNISYSLSNEPLPDEVKSKKIKGETHLISFNLFKEGKSIEDIAKERGMATSTIEGHLAFFVGTGDIDIHQFVKPEKVKLISKSFEEMESLALNPVKQKMGDTVTWGELRMVAKYLEGR